MIIYRKKHCYSHLFVNYQKGGHTKKDKSVFQESEIISIIKRITDILSTLLKNVDKKDAGRKITFLMRIDEKLSADANETVKGLISKQIAQLKTIYIFN